MEINNILCIFYWWYNNVITIVLYSLLDTNFHGYSTIQYQTPVNLTNKRYKL